MPIAKRQAFIKTICQTILPPSCEQVHLPEVGVRSHQIEHDPSSQHQSISSQTLCQN